MTDWADTMAQQAVDDGDIGGELTAAQWESLRRAFSEKLGQCIPRERVEAALKVEEASGYGYTAPRALRKLLEEE